MPKQNKSAKKAICCFCGLEKENELEFGKFYKHGDIFTHYYCLLLSSNMEQKGKDNEGILGFLVSDIRKEVRRGKRLVCSYCKKGGATLGCCNVRCKKIFHYPCGLRAGSLNQFFGEFRSFCVNHRPKQNIDVHIRKELELSNEVVCYICYDKVNLNNMISTIWAPCCKKNAWFHKNCVQQLAMSAGYFFKCPLCNDKKSFQKAMLEFGIFIPSQDASWELVPNAFEELLYRHDQCDAAICLCPKGRKYTSFNAKWELILCRTCGSQGIHMACGQLKWANPAWECSECVSILGDKSNEVPNTEISKEPGRIENTRENNSDSEDSNSDISVGRESPVSFISNSSGPCSTSDVTIKTRPGPRTFKLKQLRALREMRNTNQQMIGKTDLTSDSMRKETSTSNKENTVFMTSSSTNNGTTSYNCKEDINSSKEHSESLPSTSANSVVTLDNDNDIIEISKPRSLNSTFIINDLSRSRNETTVIVEDKGHFPVRLNDIQSDNLRKLNSIRLQNVDLVDDLDDTIIVNQDSENDNRDSISSIKITNIVSLAPEEFESMSSFKERRQGDSIDCLTPRNRNRSLDSLMCQPSVFSQHDLPETSFKRKLNNNAVTSTSSPAAKWKKLRGSLVTSAIDGKTVNKEIVKNKPATSTQCEEKEKNSVTVGTETNKTLENAKQENSTRNCAGDAGTSPAVESRNRRFTNHVRTYYPKRLRTSDHSRTASNRPNTSDNDQWGSQDCIDMASISTSSECGSTSNSIFNNVKNNRNTNCDYSRLIPEYVYIHDLKFRVYSSDSLQMILYDKFSVNINTGSATASNKSTKFDGSAARKTVQQKLFKTQCESSSNLKSEDILHHTPVCNRDKCKYSVLQNNQSRSYLDDAKENLDPVTTISFRNTPDNFSVSANNDNQDGDEHSIKGNEEDHKWRRRENVNSIGNAGIASDMEELPNVTYVISNSNDTRFKSIHGVKGNSQSLSSDHVTSSTVEKYNAKVKAKNDFHDSNKLVQRALFLEDHTNCRTENTRSIRRTRFKVSIDLEKIENFIDENPDLFVKCESDHDERCFEEVGFSKRTNNIPKRMCFSDRRITNSVIDEPKHFENFTVSSSECSISKLDSRTRKSIEHIENIIASSTNQKRDLKRVNSRLEKQCILDR